MIKCKCGSFAINIEQNYENPLLCDVCHWRTKYEEANAYRIATRDKESARERKIKELTREIEHLKCLVSVFM